ncbi:hypothetical protein DPMN_158211 [Dreissena polymorpha]|uniref:Uncharacterized protein n=1 Tax=Dreissena polymorpha TaxID=45954 RepID=A0A9D4IPK3_DREPO|nr:hypothetical protein DPMN_158211 [Dreissena polymorpha]
MDTRFSYLQTKAAMGLKFIPEQMCSSPVSASDLEWFNDDLPSPQSSLPSCTLYGRLGGKVYPTHLLPSRALLHIVIPSCTPPFTLFCPFHVCSLSHHASVKGVSVPKDLLRQN